jgi:hypothetical protein
LVNKPHYKKPNNIYIKEITMTVLGHSIPWGTHIGDRRTTDAKSWYAQFKTWWADHKAAPQEAKRADLKAHWDAKREAVCTQSAGAASDMVAPSHAESIAMAFRDLGV